MRKMLNEWRKFLEEGSEVERSALNPGGDTISKRPSGGPSSYSGMGSGEDYLFDVQIPRLIGRKLTPEERALDLDWVGLLMTGEENFLKQLSDAIGEQSSV